MFQAGTIYCEDGRILNAVCELDEKGRLVFSTEQFEIVMTLSEKDIGEIFKKFPVMMASAVIHS